MDLDRIRRPESGRHGLSVGGGEVCGQGTTNHYQLDRWTRMCRARGARVVSREPRVLVEEDGVADTPKLIAIVLVYACAVATR